MIRCLLGHRHALIEGDTLALLGCRCGHVAEWWPLLRPERVQAARQAEARAARARAEFWSRNAHREANRPRVRLWRVR